MLERIITVDGLPTRVLTAGDQGPALILLHGGICDTASLSWRALLPELGRVARVYAPDLPGYGETPRPRDTQATVDYYARFVAQLTAALGIEHAIYAGVSMGGMIALALGFTQPGLIDRLALIGTGGLTTRFPNQLLGYLITRNLTVYERVLRLGVRRPSQVRQTLRKMFHDPAAVTEALVEEIWTALQKPDTLRAFGDFGRDQLTPRGLRTCFMPRLSELTKPVLLIQGEHDYFYPKRLVEEAHRRLPHARLEIVAACGHWVNRERPELTTRLLQELVADQGG